MTVPERVFHHLNASSGPLCDACIQRQLGLPRHQQVQQITSTLGLTSDFERVERECVGCAERRLSIARRVSNAAAKA